MFEEKKFNYENRSFKEEQAEQYGFILPTATSKLLADDHMSQLDGVKKKYLLFHWLLMSQQKVSTMFNLWHL